MVTLRAQGRGRFAAVLFLGIWLLFWAAGECFALWLLGTAACALLFGPEVIPGRSHLTPGGVAAMAGFVLVWLAVWTVGGYAALNEFFRQLAGEDRVSAEGGGITLEQDRGPFRHRREIPRDTLRRFVLTSRGALAVETAKGRVELSSLGTREERVAALESLRSAAGLREEDAPAAPAAPPKGWEEIITPEGERAVAPDHAQRRRSARWAGGASLFLAWATVAMIGRAAAQPGILVFVVQLGLGAIGLGAMAVWMGWGRVEWRFGSGVVTQRRRFGSRVSDVFEARGFELLFAEERSRQAEYFALDAVAEPSPEGTPSALAPLPGKKRKRVTTSVGDPVPPRQLGAYLARSGNVPFRDRTTPEAHAADIALLKQQLGNSVLGRFAVRLVDEAERRKQA